MKLFLSFVFFILSAILFGQSKLDTAIKNLEENYAQEKVYILYNQQDYVAGETIWFKAFVFDGYQPTSISTTLYVELYDKNKVLIDKKMLPLFNGQSDGSFTLKEDLSEDTYFVRAYTTYMTNFSEDFQYIEPLLIYNPNSKLKLVKNDKAKWTASVHPEGGTFLVKQITKFAVRLKSVSDLPKRWKGFIYEKNNPLDKLVEFENLDENVTSFYFRSQLNKVYQLQLNDESGNQQIIDLPVAKKEGVKLDASYDSNFIRYTIKGIGKTLINYSIVGTINNELAYKATIINNRQVFSDKLPLSINNNQNGILNLSIFDENQNIVAQRLLFIGVIKSNKNYIKPKFYPNKILLDANLSPITYALSINSNKINIDNLSSFLWLTSDFSSSIFNPSQYFKEKNVNLDVLLISEDWKRYNWNQLYTSRIKKKVNSNYLSYIGNAIINGKKVSNSTLNLILETNNGSKEFIQVQTDEFGKFKIDNVISYENLYVSYFADDKNNKISINIQPNNAFVSYKKSFEPTNYILIPREDIKNSKNNNNPKITTNKSKQDEIELKQVNLKVDSRKKTELLDSKISSQAFQIGVRKTFDFINGDYPQISTYLNIFSFLDRNLPGFNMDFYQGDYRIYLRGPIIGSEVKIYLDETLIRPELLETINVNDIAMVKIINNSITSEAIAVYTKKGNLSPSILKNEFKNKIKLVGYDKSIPFFQENKSLYWNPNLISEPNKESIIEFFNNDNPKNYQLTIIGFDKEGNPIFYQGELK